MTIKEKLKDNDIDTVKFKDFVDEIKNELAAKGENATKITNKLTLEGEKIVDAMILSFKNKNRRTTVSRPTTIKNSDSKVDDKNIESETNTVKPDNNSKVEKDSTKTDNSSQKSFNWSNANTSNLIINVHGTNKESKSKNASPNGRALPLSTIEEIKKKKELEKQKDFSKTKAKNNNQNNKPFNNTNFKEKQQTNNHQNNNNQQNRFNTQGNKPKRQSDFNSGNIKTTFNALNTGIATGTNKRYEGKIKKDQYGIKNDENKKSKSKKGGKDKFDKYNKNLLTYSENEKTRTIKKTGAGAFIKPEPKVEEPSEVIKSIVIPEVITIKELSSKLKREPAMIVKKLFLTGKIVNVNTELSYEEAENIALEYDVLCEKEVKVNVIEELLKEEAEDPATLVTRPPVVVVMGHVDHGKTSILDTIRNTNVIAKEAGGITQHIGAYQVKVKDRLITFLDTPGHEAFTAMRLRGAKSTDIAILVVAADDGVKPQTIEAINHAKAANVEIIVAINKIDKPEANVERVKQQLSEYELVPSDWGGQTTYCEVSAKNNIGIDNLLEMILLTADVLDLKANPNRKARGIVIESLLDKGKGPVARILVQKGTLHIGGYVAMGRSFGKVRAMTDANGNRLKEAKPSTPVEILGLNDVPLAGDTFLCFDNEKEARAFAETFVSENKIRLVEESKHKVTLDALFDQIKAGELKELNIVLKADVAGSSEAIKNSLEKLSNDEVVVKVIHEGVGNINESDVTLASASNAIIIGFNVKPEPNTKSIIEKEKVDLRLYNIIYNAIDDVEKAMRGMLAPILEEKIIGNLTIRQIFKASNVGNIAGSFVNDGEIRRNAKVRVKRGEETLFDGPILSLKRFKDEVKEVKAGFECGVVLDGFSNFAVDDVLEVYVVEEKKIDNER
ncbi:MAG: translation initiation factor IF-2 [Lachnospiraceae bacterium]|nr:translation initiation factor IF-2 [Lachnospiraceae bacterium]